MNFVANLVIILAVVVVTGIKAIYQAGNGPLVCDPLAKSIPAVGRVIGGRAALFGQVPWQARINISMSNLQRTCGASIIAKSWVITAAHCLFNSKQQKIPNQSLKVFVGGLLIKSMAPQPDEKIVSVTAVEIHPKYNASDNNLDYDFALVHLSESLNWTEAIQPICLLNNCTYELEAGELCAISGWGVTNEASTTVRNNNNLMLALLPLASRSSCKAMRLKEGAPPMPQITDQMICAGFNTGKSANDNGDACLGDGGGPLACHYRDTAKMVLHGIVSWGVGCGRDGYYGVYSRPCAVMDWITRIITHRSNRSAPTPRKTPMTSTTTRTTNNNCGKSKHRNNVNTQGITASKGEFPWLVRLKLQDSNGNAIKVCTGSLVSDQWVITSGQCFLSSSVSSIIVQLAVTNFSRSQPESFNVSADSFESHPVYDIVIVKLQNSISFSDYVQPICLPESCDDEDRSSVSCTIAGWKTIMAGSRNNERGLKKAPVRLANWSNCCALANKGGSISCNRTFDNLSLCAVENTSDRCLTDVGGPLMCKRVKPSSSPYMLYGVASGAPAGCSPNGGYVVYANPCLAASWIRDKIDNSS